MSYAAVITQVQCDSDAAPRLACAVDMAERFDAALIGVGAEMVPPLAFDGGLSGIEADWIVSMNDSIQARLNLARKSFLEASKELGARAIWSSGLQMPALAVAAASRAADLVVAGGCTRRNDAYAVAPAAELALTSGRPVLITPAHGRALAARTILFAWKDSREARRALSDAMPFLEGAEAVHVIEACAANDKEDADYRVQDVASALRRRGVKAQAETVVRPHATGGDILDQAARLGADLVICGAYGHSRLGEWVFGGVTQDLLSQDDVYLLLSH